MNLIKKIIEEDYLNYELAGNFPKIQHKLLLKQIIYTSEKEYFATADYIIECFDDHRR